MTAVPNDIRMYPQAPETDDDEVGLDDLLGLLIESRWLIFSITLAAFALGAIYSFLATPIFKADGLIQVEERQSGLSGLDITEFFEGEPSVNAEIEILRSRLVLGAVVDNLKLQNDARPNYFPIVGPALARRKASDERPTIKVDSLVLPEALVSRELRLVARSESRYDLFGPDNQQVLSGEVGRIAEDTFAGETVSIFVSKLRASGQDEFLISRRSQLSAIQLLQRSLNISEKGKGSGILAISLQGDDPASISQQVNEIANVYVRQNVERKSAEAEKTLQFLNQQLPAVKQEMEVAEAALNAYRLEIGSVDLPLETQAILGTIVTVEGQLNELQRQREQAIQSYTPAHPIVIALDRQLQGFKAELNDLNNQVGELPTTQQEVLRLVRDTEVNSALYMSLLNTAQELRVVKGGTVGNVRVIDYAITPQKPVRPVKSLTLLLSLLIGGLLGVAAAFVRKALSGGIDDPDLIEKYLSVPVYATIAHSKLQDRIYRRLQSKEESRALLAVDYPQDPAIESLRNLRTALHFGMMDVKSNCIMVAGPSPAVGKSFVSVNLAAVLTDNNKKVLLIDADMRRGHLHRYLGLERDNGLSDFICGDIPIGEALHATTIPGLTFIPTGRVPPNPAELLLHQRFANCLNVLSPRFDHIIVDSPPILAVTDATIIGQMAGATLMVLKSGAHPMREIEQAVKRLQHAGVNLRGLLVNDVSMQSRRYGAGKYSYHYSYYK